MRHQTLLRSVWAALLAAVVLFPGLVIAGGPVHVRGYVRSDGTYVAPHHRSSPDGVFQNNWSTKGNFNPYTGTPGTRITPPAVRSDYQPYSGGLTPNYISPPESSYRWLVQPPDDE